MQLFGRPLNNSGTLMRLGLCCHTVRSKLCRRVKRITMSVTSTCYQMMYMHHMHGPVQVVRLREVFPQGNGFALVFDYMLSDLSEVIRNSDKPLTEVLSPPSLKAMLRVELYRHISRAT